MDKTFSLHARTRSSIIALALLGCCGVALAAADSSPQASQPSSKGSLLDVAREGKYFDADYVLQIDAASPAELASARDEQGQGLLHHLVARSHQARAVALLLYGADVNIKDKHGRTPLMLNLTASDPFYEGLGDLMILEMLLLCGADVNAPDLEGNTPLSLAIEKGDPARVALLVAHGADLYPSNVPEEKLPLRLAQSKGNAQILALFRPAAGKPLLPLSDALAAIDIDALEAHKRQGWNLNEQDEAGRTPLYHAVNEGRGDLVSWLLRRGANPDIAAKNGMTPLIRSVKNLTISGQRMTSLLLLKGANVLHRTPKGVTPLISAVEAGNDYAVLWLLSAGAELDAETPKGPVNAYATHPPTAALLEVFGLQPLKKEEPKNLKERLFAAVKKNDLLAVRQALNEGADPESADEHKNVPMSWAICYGEFEIVDALIQHGAQLNKQVRNGYHAIHGLAIWGTSKGGGDGEVAAQHLEKLMTRGVDMNLATTSGETALMMAARYGTKDRNREVLLKAGARLDLGNNEGLTALGIARKFRQQEMVDWLIKQGAPE